MYVICYEDERPVWELVSGEDAMQLRVSELIAQCVCDEDDIMVFNMDDQLT